MANGQIQQEDFILNLVQEKGVINKEEVEKRLNEQFKYKTDALGTLVYFGYLRVNKAKRDKWGLIEYSINPKKDLIRRFELIR